MRNSKLRRYQAFVLALGRLGVVVKAVRLGVLAASLAVAPVVAEVTAVSDQGFASEHVITLDAPPAEVYRALTAQVHLWWDAAHSYSGNALNFSMDARAGGCFCERLEGGGSVQHMQVVHAAPGRMLRLSGGLGPLQALGVVGAMTFSLQADADSGGSVLRYRYEVGGFSPGGLEDWAEPVDRVQLGQLMRLRSFLAKRPEQSPAPR